MRSLWLLLLIGLATGSVGEKSQADDLYLEGQASGDLIDAEDGGLPIDDEDGEDVSGSGSGYFALPDGMDQEESLSKTSVSKETSPSQPQPTPGSPHNPPATAADGQYPSTTIGIEKIPAPDVNSRDEEVGSIGPTADWFPQRTSRMPPRDTATTAVDISVNKDTDEDNSLDRWDNPAPKNSEDEKVQMTEVENEIMAVDGRGSRIYELGSPGEVTSENLWERTEVLAAVIACGVVGFLCAVFLLLLLAYRMKKKDEGSYDLGDTKLTTTQYQKAPTKEFYA